MFGGRCPVIYFKLVWDDWAGELAAFNHQSLKALTLMVGTTRGPKWRLLGLFEPVDKHFWIAQVWCAPSNSLIWIGMAMWTWPSSLEFSLALDTQGLDVRPVSLTSSLSWSYEDTDGTRAKIYGHKERSSWAFDAYACHFHPKKKELFPEEDLGGWQRPTVCFFLHLCDESKCFIASQVSLSHWLVWHN